MTAVQLRGLSPWTLFSMAVAIFMVRAAMLMLGPLLVDLAYDFDTSIAVVGPVSYTHLTLPTILRV